MRDNVVNEVEKHLKSIMELLEIEETPSTKDTPKRVAKMWCKELFKNRNNKNIEKLNEQMTLFPNEYFNSVIVIKDIPFHSTCEHHFLPFSGTVSVAYIPYRNVIGLSKIPRVVKFFSQKPQLQEQFTNEVGSYLKSLLDPIGIYVEVKAKHQCVSCRGAESDCTTKTIWCNCDDADLSRMKDSLGGE